MTRWAVAAASTVREERAELAAVQVEIAEGRRDGGAEPAALLARHSALEERIRRGTWFRGASGAGSGRAVTARELHPRLDGGALASFVAALASCSRWCCSRAFAARRPRFGGAGVVRGRRAAVRAEPDDPPVTHHDV